MSQESEYGEYKIFRPVSNGGCGCVFAAINKFDNPRKAYILKSLDGEHITKNNIKHLQNEIDILVELNNPPRNEYIPVLYVADKNNYKKEKNIIEENNRNIINIESKKVDDLINARPYYVIDYYSCGNLFYYLKNIQNEFSEIHAKLLFKKIVLAIQFCHKRNIGHLDIKPANIVFDKDFELKIIDFGYSQKFISSDILEGNKGSKNYKCPEMRENYKFRPEEADIFSLGAVLFNLVTGKPGFDSSKKNDIFYRYIFANNYENYWETIQPFIKEVSQEFKNLYYQMVSHSPLQRPTIDKILGSEWMREINNLNEKELIMLDNEVKDELKKIYKIIEKDNVEIKIAKKMEGLGFSTRSGGDNNKNAFSKNDNLKPKKIDKDFITFNHHIIINGFINEINFMNSLSNEINKKYKNKIDISPSIDELKFSIIFDNDNNDDDDENTNEDNEEIKNCAIDIELFKYEDERYLLEFLRTGGEIPEYYKYFLEIKEIICEKLIEN